MHGTLLAAAFAVAAHHILWLPSTTIVEGVTCIEWQTQRDATGARIFSDPNGAIVNLFDTNDRDVQLPPGTVTRGSAPDLWEQIEFQCATGGNPENAFQGEEIIWIVDHTQ